MTNNKTNTARPSHLATGGELLLEVTPDRVDRIKESNSKSKRISQSLDTIGSVSSEGLNWSRPKIR